MTRQTIVLLLVLVAAGACAVELSPSQDAGMGTQGPTRTGGGEPVAAETSRRRKGTDKVQLRDWEYEASRPTGDVYMDTGTGPVVIPATASIRLRQEKAGRVAFNFIGVYPPKGSTCLLDGVARGSVREAEYRSASLASGSPPCVLRWTMRNGSFELTDEGGTCTSKNCGMDAEIAGKYRLKRTSP